MTAERERYVEENLGLAHSCVRRYIGRGIEYDDLYQTACIGLVKAAEKFDEARGYRFSTYAVPVILGELKQLFRKDGSIKVSRRIKEMGIKAREESDLFLKKNGRSPQISELAAIMGISIAATAEMLCAVQMPDSLDSSSDGIEYASSECFEEAAAEHLALRQVIEKMAPADRAIIVHRYIYENTQSKTAESLGMTQVQVSRRERKLLDYMRAELK